MLASVPPPPPGPKKKTTKSAGPAEPGIDAWATRIWLAGACCCQSAGQSQVMPAACAEPGAHGATGGAALGRGDRLHAAIGRGPGAAAPRRNRRAAGRGPPRAGRRRRERHDGGRAGTGSLADSSSNGRRRRPGTGPRMAWRWDAKRKTDPKPYLIDSAPRWDPGASRGGASPVVHGAFIGRRHPLREPVCRFPPPRHRHPARRAGRRWRRRPPAPSSPPPGHRRRGTRWSARCTSWSATSSTRRRRVKTAGSSAGPTGCTAPPAVGYPRPAPLPPGDRSPPRGSTSPSACCATTPTSATPPIRPVRYYPDNRVDVEVVTRDVWTLNAGFSYGRKGGKSSDPLQAQGHQLPRHRQVRSAGSARRRRPQRPSWRGTRTPTLLGQPVPARPRLRRQQRRIGWHLDCVGRPFLLPRQPLGGRPPRRRRGTDRQPLPARPHERPLPPRQRRLRGCAAGCPAASWTACSDAGAPV